MKSFVCPSAPLITRGTEFVEVAFSVRTAFWAKEEVPTLNCIAVLSQKRLLSPETEVGPLQKVTCPRAPEPDTPPRPAAVRQTPFLAKQPFARLMPLPKVDDAAVEVMSNTLACNPPAIVDVPVEVAMMAENVEVPVITDSPLTDNCFPGVEVPIPKFPAFVSMR